VLQVAGVEAYGQGTVLNEVRPADIISHAPHWRQQVSMNEMQPGGGSHDVGFGGRNFFNSADVARSDVEVGGAHGLGGVAAVTTWRFQLKY
jgi:hypothetical protein